MNRLHFVASWKSNHLKVRKYWSVFKVRLKEEGCESTTICSQLKLEAADGKKYMSDVGNA